MKAFVTGGNGFLGGAVVRMLRDAGHDVTAASRRSGVDIVDADAVRRAMAGHDIVFHVAALPGVWGRPREFEETNIRGTENVVAACRDHGIRTLVYTSSPSVIFDGHDHVDASNDLPYPSRYEADYPRTKAAAERIVLGANDASLATIALRPHLIYGAGDTWVLPRVLDRAKQGRLRIVGDGKNVVSLTYIDNAAVAHLQAAAALRPGAACAGKPYFVTDPHPIVLWDWLNQLFAELGLPEVRGRVSLGTARAVGATMEALWRGLPLPGEPLLTRFMASQLGTSHTYSLAPAQRDFGYAPVVEVDEAFRRTVAAFRS